LEGLAGGVVKGNASDTCGTGIKPASAVPACPMLLGPPEGPEFRGVVKGKRGGKILGVGKGCPGFVWSSTLMEDGACRGRLGIIMQWA
jgi:hypothetical protein